MLATSRIFVLSVVAMATQTLQQGVQEEVAPPQMNLEQATAMFRQTFLGLDLNHDGLVDLREFMEPYLLHDHNHDMQVTLTEFLAQAPAEENREYLASDFRFHDENHDEVIDVPEMRKQFGVIDTNENNEIDEAEFIEFGKQLFVDKSHPSFNQEPPVGK